MNYSQRKHMERLLAAAPSYWNDPFGIWPSRLFGINIIESPDRPRYEMPEWLVKPTDKHDGVRWDPKLRAETNRWALSFLGTTNILPRGTVYMLGQTTAVMRPSDVVKLNNIC